jgi:ethanolamine ammonia-lyase small subunit
VSRYVRPDPWASLAGRTPARIALGRAGSALPTAEVLGFALAHARARDAVHMRLDAERIETAFGQLGSATLRVASAAQSRDVYLRRPDLGRRLSDESRARLQRLQQPPSDLAVVIADGLSATAVHAHAVPLLSAFARHVARRGWSTAPVAIACQGRVALGDEIGHLLRARIVVVILGERPGLSSPASLGIYLTFGPRPGRSDAERNCISNIRHGGLSAEQGAGKLAWLLEQALARQLTGVALKDDSDPVLGNADVRPVLPGA